VLTSALGGAKWSASRPSRFISRHSLSKQLGGPQSISGHCGDRFRESNFGLSALSQPLYKLKPWMNLLLEYWRCLLNLRQNVTLVCSRIKVGSLTNGNIGLLLLLLLWRKAPCPFSSPFFQDQCLNYFSFYFHSKFLLLITRSRPFWFISIIGRRSP
jgi:hypothetical protein